MTGTVRPYDTADGKRWRFVVDLGKQQCRRCEQCGARTWDLADTTCPKRKCRGQLGDLRTERRQTSSRGHKTKRDAARELRKVATEVEAKTYVPPSNVTTGEYLAAWIDGYRGKPTTTAGYRLSIERYLTPRIGHVALRQLTPEQIDKCYRELEASGGRGGRPLAPKTVRGAHVALRKALQVAVERGRIGRNPAALASPPSTRGATAQAARDCWDEPQLRRFLAHVADDRLYACWRLMSATGMRRGEICGLRWVNLDGAQLTVGLRTVTTAAGKVVAQGDGKSDSAIRTISLDPATVAALRTHKVAQLEERLHAGPVWSQDPDDADVMFTLADGRGLRPDYLSRRFGQLARAAGLPADGGLHRKLRHTYATLALRAGVPVKVVSERLGHKDVGVTLAIYAHVSEADDQRAAEATAGFLPG